MTGEQNKALVRSFWKAYEENDVATLKAILSPELAAQVPNVPEIQSREQHLEGINRFNTAFSDRRFTVEEMVAEGDTIATRTTMQGIHSGVLQGQPPTGKSMKVTGFTLERIKDGQIAERWFSFDVANVMQQLGLVPVPQPSE